jgi:hypothetical protein
MRAAPDFEDVEPIRGTFLCGHEASAGDVPPGADVRADAQRLMRQRAIHSALAEAHRREALLCAERRSRQLQEQRSRAYRAGSVHPKAPVAFPDAAPQTVAAKEEVK